jgi:predicted ATPase
MTRLTVKLKAHSRAEIAAWAVNEKLQSWASIALRDPSRQLAYGPGTHSSSGEQLPNELSSFVGRERELAELNRLLKSKRLITLTGAGGVGKTRLALQLARASAATYEDGVALVRLGALTDAELVMPTIAQVLGLRDVGRPVRESLIAYLRQLHLLLLLDNFEHLSSAAPLVSDLLVASPDLQVLVTSRQALHLVGEQLYPVQPLDLPAASREARATAVEDCAAIQLFVERTRQVVPAFDVTPEITAIVADICMRMDGLPLAIEHAAARSNVLSPAHLLDRLDRRLSLLVGGARDLPARQRSLRDTISWSHDLLAPGDRRLFRRLAVFAGGFGLDAAEAVCRADIDLDSSVLDGLASLVDCNLLRAKDQMGGEPRFMMLETILEFALEQLGQSGEQQNRAERHALYFLATAEEAEMALLRGPGQVEWFERLEQDHDNLRAALRWAGATLLGLADRICSRGALAAPGASPTSELRRPLPDGLHLVDLIGYAKTELGPAKFESTRKAGSRLALENVLAEFARTS